MAALSRRGRERDGVIWPGFVDALATLLLVIIFLLLIFVIAQFFLGQALSGRDEALRDLESQVSELGDLLALERRENATLSSNVSRLSNQLQASVAQRDELQGAVRLLSGERAELSSALAGVEAKLGESEASLAARLRELEIATGRIEADEEIIEALEGRLASLISDVERLDALKAELEQSITETAARLAEEEEAREENETRLLAEQELSQSARAELALANQQMAALRTQLAELNAILTESEQLNEEQGAQIEALGKRLNAALATKVQELNRYRSEFFGRLRETLGSREGVRVVGDRFVFQSEVLFASGSAELGEGGVEQLSQLADTLKEIAATIPDDLDWVLRVDGHTDRVPIATFRFPSNWELSSARAIEVVKFLINEGLPPQNMVAAGFGQYQPLDDSPGEIANSRNRRIEFKLTQR